MIVRLMWKKEMILGLSPKPLQWSGGFWSNPGIQTDYFQRWSNLECFFSSKKRAFMSQSKKNTTIVKDFYQSKIRSFAVNTMGNTSYKKLQKIFWYYFDKTRCISTKPQRTQREIKLPPLNSIIPQLRDEKKEYLYRANPTLVQIVIFNEKQPDNNYIL